MLESVPTGTVSLPFPATTMRAASPGLPQTSCEPRCRSTSQPASLSADRTSRYFFAIERPSYVEPRTVPVGSEPAKRSSHRLLLRDSDS